MKVRSYGGSREIKGASGEGQNLLSGPSESSDIKDKGKIELLYSFVWYSG